MFTKLPTSSVPQPLHFQPLLSPWNQRHPNWGIIGLGRAPLPVGRSPLALLTTPWHMTFHGEIYHSEGTGDVGIGLLMLLPLALLAPRTRTLALLAVTAGVSYVGWWFSPQITRHLLPTLAIAAALAGVGVASVGEMAASGARRVLATAVPVGVIVGLVATPFFFLPNWKTGLPVDLILGKETAAEYIAREVPSAAVLMAASGELPGDASVGYVGVFEGPQIYTEARLRYFASESFGPTPEAVIANLEQLGIDYLVWNRPESRLEDWGSTLLSTDFLRDHSRIIAGADGTYVFEILADSGKAWGLAPDAVRNLLADPKLDQVESGGPWATDGRVEVDRDGVSLRPRSSISQLVSVPGGVPYILVASGKCNEAMDRVDLALRWFDKQGVAIDSASETVIPGAEQSKQFLWRRAPDSAATVTAEVSTTGGSRCTFDELALYGLS